MGKPMDRSCRLLAGPSITFRQLLMITVLMLGGVFAESLSAMLQAQNLEPVTVRADIIQQRIELGLPVALGRYDQRTVVVGDLEVDGRNLKQIGPGGRGVILGHISFEDVEFRGYVRVRNVFFREYLVFKNVAFTQEVIVSNIQSGEKISFAFTQCDFAKGLDISSSKLFHLAIRSSSPTENRPRLQRLYLSEVEATAVDLSRIQVDEEFGLLKSRIQSLSVIDSKFGKITSPLGGIELGQVLIDDNTVWSTFALSWSAIGTIYASPGTLLKIESSYREQDRRWEADAVHSWRMKSDLAGTLRGAAGTVQTGSDIIVFKSALWVLLAYANWVLRSLMSFWYIVIAAAMLFLVDAIRNRGRGLRGALREALVNFGRPKGSGALPSTLKWAYRGLGIVVGLWLASIVTR